MAWKSHARYCMTLCCLTCQKLTACNARQPGVVQSFLDSMGVDALVSRDSSPGLPHESCSLRAWTLPSANKHLETRNASMPASISGVVRPGEPHIGNFLNLAAYF